MSRGFEKPKPGLKHKGLVQAVAGAKACLLASGRSNGEAQCQLGLGSRRAGPGKESGPHHHAVSGATAERTGPKTEIAAPSALLLPGMFAVDAGADSNQEPEPEVATGEAEGAKAKTPVLCEYEQQRLERVARNEVWHFVLT